MIKTISVISNDWHLNKNNIDQIIDLVSQQCELAAELKVDNLICLGDVFDSRNAQPIEVLDTFLELLDLIGDYGLTLYAIPGNHDKVNYSSKISYLRQYRDHKNFKLFDSPGKIKLPEYDLNLHFIPFFNEEVWINHYNNYIEENSFKGTNILLTHIATIGSRNNDGSIVESNINGNLFLPFNKVLSGHYHNRQQIGNFYHLPSIQQNNFGEDPDKGFTILNSDGTISLFKSKFKEFIKVTIDLETNSWEDVTLLTKTYKDNSNNVRFEFKGPENLLKSINKEEFTSIGIDVKTKIKEIDQDIEFAETEEVVELNAASIYELFDKFCEQENIDKTVGIKYLNNKLV